MNSLLIGNGLNRLSKQLNWQKLLNRVASGIDTNEIRKIENGMPFSLYFEELCTYESGGITQNEIKIKKKVAEYLKDIEWNDLHRKYVERFDVILTTNYDYTLEKSTSPYRDKLFKFNESKYSIYRHVKVQEKMFWHIHGELLYPQTILLGYDQYIGYVNRIKNYLSSESPLAGGRRSFDENLDEKDFEKCEWLKYSWVDHFLRDHLHIVGLGLDFAEIDIWWLLVNKARRNKVGSTYYYVIDCGNRINERNLKLLESFGVVISAVTSDNYFDGYKNILASIESNIFAQEKGDKENSEESLELKPAVMSSQTETKQLALPLNKARRRKKSR